MLLFQLFQVYYDLDETVALLNAVNQKMQFTLEKESNGSLAFLDTCIVRTENIFKFKVF